MKEINLSNKLQEIRIAFERAQEKAKGFISDPFKLTVILEEVKAKAERSQPAMKSAMGHLVFFIQVTTDFLRGAATTVPRHHIVQIIAALVYFITPADVIPDFIVGIGFIDDIFVISLVAAAVQSTATRYASTRRRFDVSKRLAVDQMSESTL